MVVDRSVLSRQATWENLDPGAQMNLPGSPVRFCNCTPRQFSSRSELTVGSKRENLGTSWVRLAAGESVARVSHLHHYGDVVADLATGSVRWERHETPGRLLSSTDSHGRSRLALVTAVNTPDDGRFS
jgi:hypothetical protein